MNILPDVMLMLPELVLAVGAMVLLLAGAVFSPPMAPVSNNAMAPIARISSGRRTNRSA